MRRMLLAALLLLSLPVHSAPVFNPATGNWYDLVDSGANGSWANAENNAIALGGHLVTINDAAEQLWLRNTFGLNERFWIGFTDAATEGTWVWSSGEAVTYINWETLLGSPNNATPPAEGEDYAVINWDSTGGWNDWDHQRGDYPASTIFGIAEWSNAASVPGPPTVTILVLGLVTLIFSRRRACTKA